MTLADLLSSHLGRYQPNVDAALADLTGKRIISRIWAHDHTVWKPDPTNIAHRLGWLHSAAAMVERLSRLEAFAQAARADGYTHALLLGMGGSSLAPEVFSKVFGPGGNDLAPGPSPARGGEIVPPSPAGKGGRGSGIHLAVLDTTDPGAVLAHAEWLDPARTLFIVSTKSGTTVETLSACKFFYNWTVAALGPDRAGAHFVAITDPGSKLAALADQLGFRDAFLNDPTIGGRFSVLSYFGLAPAALLGLDVRLLLARAQEMAAACGPDVAIEENPGAVLGAILGALAQVGRDKMTLVASPAIAPFGDWVEQLVAESTGKEGVGILPVVGEPLGPPSVYGNDRVFVYLQLEDDPLPGPPSTAREGGATLAAAGHPIVRLQLRDRYDLGGQFFLWGIATAVACHLLGVNPFDQPNVEAAKRRAQEMVAAYRATGALPAGESAPLTPAALHEFLAVARPGDYIALQAYVQPTEETDAALQSLRIRLRDRYRLATTVGYGPRFLHSTGQLHKGDAGRGHFIQLTADHARDVPIPDEAGSPASSITFGVLELAQALGDQRALLDASRRVIRFHLKPSAISHQLSALGE